MKPITKIALAVCAVCAAVLVFGPSNRPGAAQATPLEAPAAAAAAAPSAQLEQREDPAALAQETRRFLEGAAVDLRAGLQARDAQGIRDAIEWPATRLVSRWNALSDAERAPHAPCVEAIDAMRLLAGDMTAGRDSLEHRKAIEREASVIDAATAHCR